MQQTIPASQIVSVIPSVVGAGGSALVLNGLMLTNTVRIPTGTVLSFPDDDAVGDYFGEGSYEQAIATNYFLGYDNSFLKPASLLVASYPTVAAAAFLRGGNVSGLSLAQLQALAGTLTIVVDGYSWTSGSINLSSASSFSSAAGLIQSGFGSDPVESNFTASIGATFTATGTGTSLVVTAVTGLISIGDLIAGTGVTAGTKINLQVSGTTGGAGTYTTSQATTASGGTVTSFGTVLDVTVIASGQVEVGQTVAGASVTGAPKIASQISGAAGGVGVYALSVAQTAYIASEAMTGIATPFTVTFDTISGGFLFTSGITGLPSTIAFPTTNSFATALDITQATGAVVSQGAPIGVPGTNMDAIKRQTQNWATFWTVFDPDGGSGNTQKLAFSSWTNAQLNRYEYEAWDTDITPTESTSATGSFGYLVKQAGYSGTKVIYAPINLAAISGFQSGAIASLDFSRTNGRATMAFRSQAGLVPDVTDGTVAQNLLANGYNFYGTYGTANQPFTWFYNGSVSGSFLWSDSYVQQIQLNAALQLATMSLLGTVGNIPYNNDGFTLLKAAFADPINAALNFGTIRAGVQLSSAQIAEVNNQAGVAIDQVLFQRGYYVQVLAPPANVRAARGSPSCTLWYTDGQSVQQVNLASIEVQ
jgi:hypothetical protein